MPRIPFARPLGEDGVARLRQEMADQERHAAWARSARASAIAARAHRLEQLALLEPAWSSVVGRRLDDGAASVLIRDEAMRATAPERAVVIDDRERPDDWDQAKIREVSRRSRPPLTQLIIPNSRALNTWLAMIHQLHIDEVEQNTRPTTTRKGRTESWAMICGRHDGPHTSTSRAPRTPSAPRARRARMERDLVVLRSASLVAFTRTSIEGFRFLREDRGTRRYTLPAEGTSLPAGFFAHGWDVVLTPSEIAALLMVRHAHAHRSEFPYSSRWGTGVQLTQEHRSTYGVSPEAYESLHDLAELGLVGLVDPLAGHRRRGKIRLPELRREAEAAGGTFAPTPYEWRPLNDAAFDRPALPTIRRAFTDSPTPWRWDDERLLPAL